MSCAVVALTENAVDWVDRIYSPLVTLWVFLDQVLSQDHSCRAAVARLIAHCVSRGTTNLLGGDRRNYDKSDHRQIHHVGAAPLSLTEP